MKHNFWNRFVSIFRGYWISLLGRFIVIAGAFWLMLEPVNFFFPDTWGQQVQTWRGGAVFWVLLSLSVALALITTRRQKLTVVTDTSPQSITENCGDAGISLSHQRLMVSAAFGSYFAGLLEARNIHTILPDQIDCKVPNAPAEMSAIEQILWSLTQPRGERLVVIAADAGMGKSTLAAKITRCLFERDNVERILGDSAKNRRVDVVSGSVIEQEPEIYDAATCFKKISAQAGVPYPSGRNANRRALRAISDKLVGRKTLIIVDNLETVQDVEELLSGLSSLILDDVRAIVTTRDIGQLHSFPLRQLMVRLRPIQDYPSVIRFLRWHIHHYQSVHSALTQLESGLENHRNLRRLLDRTGGVPLLMQLVLSKIAMNSWSQIEILPELFGTELLEYLYAERWHELEQQAPHGHVAQRILTYVTREQYRGKRVTLQRLHEYLQKDNEGALLDGALRMLHERFLIVNQDPNKGNFVVFPTFARFVEQATVMNISLLQH
jgi:hypothetical protein